MSSAKRIEDFRVTRNVALTPRHFLLELLAPGKLPGLLPGQFVQVLVENSTSTFLRRPFSIHRVNETENTLDLLVQIKGEGTRKLSRLREGDRLNLIYPLGNSFSLQKNGPVLLIGGGCGVAPLLFLAQSLCTNDTKVAILIGGRKKHDLFEIEEYRKCGEVFITTEDGTEGEKGLVTDHSILQKEKLAYSMIYCCGPDPMMESVASVAHMHNIECEVSLENTMACGFGVCLCCITPTIHGNQRVCVEGPVFNTKELGW